MNKKEAEKVFQKYKDSKAIIKVFETDGLTRIKQVDSISREGFIKAVKSVIKEENEKNKKS